MSSSPSLTAAKRACDACHRRKVKCIIADGAKQCKNCSASGLSCTYNAIPQKKGPKGSRAKVISELRETQRLVAQHGPDSGPSSPAYSMRPGILSYEIIDICVTYFFNNLYPTQPILDRTKVRETISRMYEDVEAYVFVVSLCAYMFIQPNLPISINTLPGFDAPDQSAMSFGQTLLREATRVRKSLDWIENPTTLSVITSFFFFGSYFCLDSQNLAWFHLREATTVAQLIGMHDETHYQSSDMVENIHKRRLFWLLFVTERAYALQQHRPVTLHATIKLPTLDEDPSETAELSGFIHLVNLFRPFDDTFVGLWNKASDAKPPGTWLRAMQQDLSDALPVYLNCTESQAVDLRLSQSWLKTMVWQLSISHGALSSLAADNAMSFKYPIEVSRDMVAAAGQFTQQSMENHGIGLIEKLFDVACTLTDVISCVPYEQHNFDFGPRDYLTQIIQLISKLRGGQQRYMPLIQSKIQDAMPNSPSYGLPLMPAASSSKVSEDATSTTSSKESTPFGSPPYSAIDSQGMGFEELGLAVSPIASQFSGVTSGTPRTDHGDLTLSAPMRAFRDPMGYESEGSMKFDPNG